MKKAKVTYRIFVDVEFEVEVADEVYSAVMEPKTYQEQDMFFDLEAQYTKYQKNYVPESFTFEGVSYQEET